MSLVGIEEKYYIMQKYVLKVKKNIRLLSKKISFNECFVTNNAWDVFATYNNNATYYYKLIEIRKLTILEMSYFCAQYYMKRSSKFKISADDYKKYRY